MPLRLTLKPHERLIINGASIRNGERSADLLLETQCKFLRESEIIYESEADTLCKQVYVTLQAIYLMDEPDTYVDLLMRQGVELMHLMPGSAEYLKQIVGAVDDKQYHRAIKFGKKLIELENLQNSKKKKCAWHNK